MGLVGIRRRQHCFSVLIYEPIDLRYIRFMSNIYIYMGSNTTENRFNAYILKNFNKKNQFRNSSVYVQIFNEFKITTQNLSKCTYLLYYIFITNHLLNCRI